MARARERITDRALRGLLKKPGMHLDGQSLYLHVGEQGSASWIFRYAVDGKRREMGLGPYPEVPLADARDKAIALRRQRIAGTDPLEQKRAAAMTAAVEAAKVVVFEECAHYPYTARTLYFRH